MKEIFCFQILAKKVEFLSQSVGKVAASDQELWKAWVSQFLFRYCFFHLVIVPDLGKAGNFLDWIAAGQSIKYLI